MNKYPEYCPDSNCVKLRRCTEDEMDELRILTHPEWKLPHDVINVPHPAHYKCKTYKVKCFIKKETKDYWEVTELWGEYSRYYKCRGLFKKM